MPAASAEPAARRRLFLLILVVIPAACAAAVLLFSRGGTPVPAPAPARGPAPAGHLFFDGVQISDFSQNQSAPGAVTEVPDPLGGSRPVLALTVHNRDVTPITPTENPRAQLLSPALIHPGRSFWLATSVLLPRHFPQVKSWLTLASVYGPPAAGPGPWDIAVDAVRGQGEMLMLRRGDQYSYDIPWAIPTPRGRWVNIVVHEHFSRHGFIELWVDGRPISLFADSPYNPLEVGPTRRLRMATRGYSDGDGANVAKIMQYRNRGQFAVGTVYFAGLWLGTSREAVEAEPR